MGPEQARVPDADSTYDKSRDPKSEEKVNETLPVLFDMLEERALSEWERTKR